MELDKDFIRDIEDASQLYENGTILISDNIQHSSRQLIRQVTHYLYSQYINGMFDDQGRRKPFRNIGNAIVDIEWRATNIDRKNIVPRATDGDHVFAMVLREELRQWMKESYFGDTIDDIRRKEIEYGSVFVKKIETKDKLIIEEVDFENLMFDMIDPAGGLKISRSYLSPYDLNKKKSVWENVSKAIKGADKTREDDNESSDKRVEVWDIEGYFPRMYFEDTESDDYALYNVIVSIVANEKVYHYHEELDEPSYKFHSRKRVPQRGMGQGVWEEVFEEQIGTNEAVIQERIAQEYAGRVIPKTNKPDLPNNAADFEDGQIMFLEDGEYFESVILNPGNMPEYWRQIDSWFVNAQRKTSSYNAISGEEQKAGTPFAAQALQAAQGGSIFDKRRVRFGSFIQEIVEDWIYPYLVKKIQKEHKLTAAYSPKEIEVIDNAIRQSKIKAKVLEGQMIDEQVLSGIDRDLAKAFNLGGKERTLKIPKGYITLEKIKKKIVTDITGEMSDEQQKIMSITQTLGALAPDDPKRKELIEDLMELQDIGSFGVGMAPDAPQSAPKTGTEKTIEKALPKGQ